MEVDTSTMFISFLTKFEIVFAVNINSQFCQIYYDQSMPLIEFVPLEQNERWYIYILDLSISTI